ncbi:MAG: Translational regulator CsrA [Anaerolineae bacterium]|nr:Translational regulator CsrA [Anaerolineae bacterium]
MLVLGRKPNESLLIGDDIVITVLSVEGDRVKIGISAPGNVRILRQELYDAIKEENLRATKLAAPANEALLTSLQDLFQANE